MAKKNSKWANRLELGAWLRAWREEHSLTQRELAVQLGCSSQYLTLIERGGVSRPGIPMLRSIAQHYGVNVEELTDVYYPRDGKSQHKMAVGQ